MKIVIAPDSFKGSLSSVEVVTFAEAAIRAAVEGAEIVRLPIADGGEGTVDAFRLSVGGEVDTKTVTDPLGRKVQASYCVLPDGTAVVEMAQASGLILLNEEELDPLRATTYGTGELIRHALDRGCRRFIIGIGGSATNDGGAGMLQALGFGLLDRVGRQAGPGARGLAELAEIRDEGALPALRECSFRVACDVTNPLCGERGASAVYGPQKGAGPAVIAEMDRWLADYASLCRRKYPRADPDRPGTGAAGGLGFAFLAFTNARLEPGAEIVLEETGLESYVREADVLVTGEGRLDGQSAMGKAPVGAAKAAKRYGKLTVAFSGCVGEGAEDCNRHGIDAFFPILRGPASLEEAMDPETARRNLAGAAEQAFRLLVGGRGLR